jgi:cytochrome c biogenesis protein CcmG/thiol:disulfide interchange protein DsbE
VTGSRRLVLALLGIAILVAGGLIVRSASSSKATAATPQRAALIRAAALPLCPTTSGSKSATSLPSLTLPCLGNGPSVDLAKLTGPLVVNIWAGPCTECRVEAPYLASFASAARGKVAMLGVVDGPYNGETWDDALDASRGLGFHYPSVFDANGKLVQWTKAIGIPVSLLVKPDGSLAYTQIGVLHGGQLDQLVQKYLGVTVTPSAPVSSS